MATQDDYVKTALRLPRELHASLLKDAEEAGRSMNSEIIDRLSRDDSALLEAMNRAIDAQKALTKLLATMTLLATGAAGKEDEANKRLLELVAANAQTYIEKATLDYGGQMIELMDQLEKVLDQIPVNDQQSPSTSLKELRRHNRPKPADK